MIITDHAPVTFAGRDYPSLLFPYPRLETRALLVC